MAHEIDCTGGIARAAFARMPAWHNLGKVFPDSMTVDEAFQEAGLDWTVSCRAPFFEGADGAMVPLTGSRVIVRDDSQKALGVVSKTWTPVQNEQLREFIRAVVGHGGRLESAGSLRGGKRVWMLLDLKKSYEPLKGDPVHQYLVFANGHDGVTRFRGLGTGVRVVCQNTWSAALGGENENKGISFRHDGNILNYVAKAQEYIADLFKSAETRKEEAEALAKMVKMKDADMGAFFVKQLRAIQVKEEAEVKRALDHLANFQAAETNTRNGMAGTGWAAFQTWSEYLDYRPSKRDCAAARWESNLFGDLARSKSNAWQELLTLAK